MSDRWVVAMAAGAVLGAHRPSPLPLSLAGLAVAVAFAIRRPALVCMTVTLLAAVLAQRALDGLHGMEPATVAGVVTLVSDPEPTLGGLRADARLGGRRVELRARGVAADSLQPRLAGEVVRLRGHLVPAPPDEPWLVSRHVAGRLTVLAVEGSAPGHRVVAAANGLRRLIDRGAASLPADRRSLYTGLVMGDDRAQSAALADDFLGAGLTHLLAVSGQNVAFTLVLTGPLLRRLRLWPRLAVTLGVIGMFGIVTRFEPSVLRASSMAALAATLVTVGRPASRVRIIALAVTGLVLVDPLLVRAVGFQLSVCASVAIVVLAPPLASALPGPSVLREGLGVTIAAQLGVAPVLLGTFGPVPVASIPANLLAVPVAGLVMVWGLTAGVLAGVVGAPWAGVLHAPTGVALRWLELVAARAADAPLGALGVAQVAVGGVALMLAIAERRGLASMLTVAVLVAAVVGANAPLPLRSQPTVGVVRWHAASTDVVVLGGAGGRSSLSERRVLEALRGAGIRDIDLLVVADPTVPGETVDAVLDAHRTGAVVVAPGALSPTVPDAVVASPVATEVVVGSLVVRLVPADGRLVVEAGRGSGSGG